MVTFPCFPAKFLGKTSHRVTRSCPPHHSDLGDGGSDWPGQCPMATPVIEGGFSIWSESGVGISAQDRMWATHAGTQTSASACRDSPGQFSLSRWKKGGPERPSSRVQVTQHLSDRAGTKPDWSPLTLYSSCHLWKALFPFVLVGDTCLTGLPEDEG